MAARLRVVALQIFGGHVPQAQGAHEAVGVERGRSEHFRERARTEPPIHLHLPQAVLRVHEAEGEMRVLDRRGIDVRDAVAVAQHFRLRS
jgi:hypothetical protein